MKYLFFFSLLFVFIFLCARVCVLNCLICLILLNFVLHFRLSLRFCLIHSFHSLFSFTLFIHSFHSLFSHLTPSSSIGIACLRDIGLQRPACRTHVLRQLLKYTADVNDALRGPVVRVVITNLLPYDMFETHIVKFATKLLQSLVTPGNTTNATMTTSTTTTTTSAGNESRESGVSSTQEPSGVVKLEQESGHASDSNALQQQQQQHVRDVFTDASTTTTGSEGMDVEPAAGGVKEEQKQPLDRRVKSRRSSAEAGDSPSSRSGVIGAGVVMHDDDIKRRVVLYYALCAKKHDLLIGLVDVYIQMNRIVCFFVAFISTFSFFRFTFRFDLLILFYSRFLV
jgi:hypothetical protein